jgi:hypothetical protein
MLLDDCCGYDPARDCSSHNRDGPRHTTGSTSRASNTHWTTESLTTRSTRPSVGIASVIRYRASREMRQIDTQRCDDIYRAMLPAIKRGGRGSALTADAATRALAHKVLINGMEAPMKIAQTDRQRRDLVPIPIETIRRIMDGGEVVFDQEGPLRRPTSLNVNRPNHKPVRTGRYPLRPRRESATELRPACASTGRGAWRPRAPSPLCNDRIEELEEVACGGFRRTGFSRSLC